MENQYINFKRERDFNGLISNTFDFIKQEFKPLGKALLTYAGPFILITAFIAAMYQSSIYSSPKDFASSNIFDVYSKMFSGLYFLFIISSIISNTVLILTIYSYIKLYVTKGKGNFAEEEIKHLTFKNFVPVFFSLIVMSFMIAIGSILFIVPGIYLAISLSLVMGIMILEDKTFNEAMTRSMYLIKDYWWFTFGVLIVIYLIAVFSGAIFLLPQTIMTMFYTLNAINGTAQGSVSILFTVFTVIGTFFSTLLYSLPYVTLGFHFYSQVEIKENPTLISKIDEINENNE
ncbi:MAG: hypothetical protein JXR51_11335 [Bacteroidales bacterium]|nr:hypothetical protein [Bacteroidales bacterium]MBN2757762.1 hypothetical protein [Bacteroidales bacterium]